MPLNMYLNIVFVFLTWSFHVSAQLLSSERAFRDDPASEVHCWGDTDDYREALKLPNDVSLAGACVRSGVMMECGYTRDPNRPYFANVGYRDAFKNIVSAYGLYPPWEGNNRFTFIPYELAEICSIKCACAGGSVTKPVERYNQNEANYTIVMKFDKRLRAFQNSDQIASSAVSENAQYMYGLRLAEDPFAPVTGKVRRFRYGNSRRDRFYRPKDDEESPIDSFKFVGYKSNQPICNRGNNVEEDLGPVYDLVEREVDAGETLDSTSLCAHQFYGGRSKGNLGAVCVYPPGASGNSRRVLSIQNILKAPQFTNDYYPPMLYQMAFVKALEAYCGSQCHCSGENETEVDARVSAWERLVTGIKDPGTALNQEITQEEPILEQGGGELQQPVMQTFDIEQPNPQGQGSCSSNSDCCPDCVCAVKLEETLTHLVQWAGQFILGCIARKAINPQDSVRGNDGGL